MDVAANLESWMAVQRKWMYLENVLQASDIKQQVPAEYRKFANCDAAFKAYMKKLGTSANVVQATTAPTLLNHLTEWNSKLDLVQRALIQYTDRKRKAFGRFYFLSNLKYYYNNRSL